VSDAKALDTLEGPSLPTPPSCSLSEDEVVAELISGADSFDSSEPLASVTCLIRLAKLEKDILLPTLSFPLSVSGATVAFDCCIR